MLDQKKYTTHFKNALKGLGEGKGSLILIEGEQGLGKSTLLEAFSNIASENNPKILNILIQNQEDENKLNLKPFRPILKAIEAIHNASTMSAKRKLAFNMSLTVLTSIPLIGDAFYAAKELSRDWKQYKKDQSQEQSSQTDKSAQLIDAFKAKASSEPIVLLFDDMHFSDNASVSILKRIVSILSEFPIILVVSYNPAHVQTSADSLYNFVNENIDHKVELEPLTKQQLREYSKINIPFYGENQEFDDWFYSVTGGIPSEIIEYKNYFKSNPAFDSNNDLVLDLESESLPASASKALASTLEVLTTAQLQFFICAAAEGREFTVSILSDLMQINPIETISKLRETRDHNIVRSIGAFNKFGTKTTVYRFNHNYHFRFFRDLPEYEEKVELHSKITDILKVKLNQTDDSELKKEIAGEILFHSGASENSDGEIEALKVLKNEAERSNDNELKAIINDNFNKEDENISEPINNYGLGGGIIGFDSLRNLLTNKFNKGNVHEVEPILGDFLVNNTENLGDIEKITLDLISIRSKIEVGQYDQAKANIAETEPAINSLDNQQLECLLINTKAILYFKQGYQKRAISYLKKAAELALNLPGEMMILTLLNISTCLEQIDPEEAEQYSTVAERLKREYNFNLLIN